MKDRAEQERDMAWMNERYQEALDSEYRYALIQMNIKKFRYLYYRYGEQRSNEILEKVSETIKKTLGPLDSIARQYADNFIILKKYEDRKQIEVTWLRACIDELFEIEDEAIFHNIYTSFGFFLMDDKTCEMRKAIEYAQLCRVMSSSITKRVFSYEFFDESFYNTYMQNCYLEELTAKAREGGLYQVYIQPKVDTLTKEIVGGEALLRLRNEEGQMVPIGEFLPILNNNGYIRMVDLFVFDTVAKEMEKRNFEKKPNVMISFNVSNSFYYDALFIKEYDDLANKYEVDASLYQLEFMESINMENEVKLKQVIEEIHRIGMSCALDDFGNGYSSFNVLRHSGVDTVKLDRCFFEEDDGELKWEILKTVIKLMKTLGVSVIAEGVETQEDVAFLEKTGCDEIQGFYYYKPMPMKEFFQLIDDKEA